MLETGLALAEGQLLGDRYTVLKVLSSDPQSALLTALDDSAGTPEMRYLLCRPASLPADLRSVDVGSPLLCGPALESFEWQGLRLSVLPFRGGSTLAGAAPPSNDESALDLLLAVAQILAEAARIGADVSQVTAPRLVLGPAGSISYAGPLLVGDPADLSAALATWRDRLIDPERQWSAELNEFCAEWRAQGDVPVGQTAAQMRRLRGPSDLRTRVAIATSTGRVRLQNEDAVLHISHTGEGGLGNSRWELVALADGMGGHRGGQLASHLALSELAAKLFAQTVELATSEAGLPWSDNARVSALLQDAAQKAHRAVLDLASAGEERAPGSTLTATLRLGRRLFVLHVGDSRAYLWRAGHLRQITRDDTLVQQKVEAGELSRGEAKLHSASHVLTNALGQTPDLAASSHLHLLLPGDRLLLCSDGLIEGLGDMQIGGWLSRDGDLDALAARLVQSALDGQSRDNVSVAVVEFVREGLF